MFVARRNVLCSLMALPMLSLRGRAVCATVFSGYELQAAVETMGEGSEITLAAGNYGGLGRLIRVVQSQVTLRAEPGVLLHDVDLDLAPDGHHRILAGVRLAGTSNPVSLAAITEGATVSATIQVRGVGDIVRNCTIENWAKGKKGVDVYASAKQASVEYNWFRNCQPGAASAIMVGNGTKTTDVVVGATLVSNTVENCAAGSTESLSFKSSGNSMAGNVLINSNNLSNRHGSGNLFSNNRLRSSMGLVIQDGPGIVLEFNVIESMRQGPGISIMAGTTEHNAQVQGDHPAAYGVTLRNNQGPLVIGRTFNKKMKVPARNTVVESHVGPIKVMKLAEGTILPGSGKPPAKRARMTDGVAHATDI
jgi:hypothetical protein